jgi:hypothetical protein
MKIGIVKGIEINHCDLKKQHELHELTRIDFSGNVWVNKKG